MTDKPDYVIRRKAPARPRGRTEHDTAGLAGFKTWAKAASNLISILAHRPKKRRLKKITLTAHFKPNSE